MKDQINNGASSRSGDAIDHFDVLSIEWQAREMRAAFLNDALRGAVRRIAERIRAFRGDSAGTAHTV